MVHPYINAGSGFYCLGCTMSYSRCLSLSALLASTFITPVAAMDLTLLSPDNNAILEYTHTNTPVPEPASSSFSYKTAAVCFLGFGECGDGSFSKSDEDFTVDTVKQCQNEGYTITSCAAPQYPSGQCPYNSNYYASCKDDTARACKEAGYDTSCNDGYIKDSSQICPYNSSYYKCKCNPCDGYTYTQAQATADGYVADGSCNSCGTTKYKRKNNPCTGFLTCECGGQIGTSTCKSGSVTKYAVCKTCCENKCSETTCPAGYVCELETCSNKYCITGCAVNYTNWCTLPITDCGTLGYTKTADQCPDGYLKCPYGDTVFCPNVPKAGYILYSDMTTSAEIISGKTPIGVVFDQENRLATALTQSGYLVSGGYNTHVTGLTTCGSSAGGWGEYDSSGVLSCDTDGKANTAAIINFAQSSGKSFPAAEYCYNYATAGTKTGDWWLPSMYELSRLIANKTTVNDTLTKLGKTTLYNTTSSYSGACGYWSSTEADAYAQWYYTSAVSWAKKYDENIGGNSSSSCGYGYFIARPIIGF